MRKPPFAAVAGLGVALAALVTLPALASSETEPTRNPTLASEPGQLTAADYRRAERLPLPRAGWNTLALTAM